MPLEGSDQLSVANYQRLAELIHSHSGICMPPAKRTMLEGRLRKRLRSLGISSLSAYCDYLFHQDGLKDEQAHLIDAVTTNKTDFFREPDHFDFIRHRAIPEILANRGGSGEHLIKAWSAAASTGAEAYSLAMVLADMADGPDPFRFRILGTDICSTVLDDAARAVYASEMMDPVPIDLRKRYVMRSIDPKKRVERIVPELRRAVSFEWLNLMDKSYPFDADFDIIFCRNILIYFNKATQIGVLERLSRHLRRGGFLILGHAESMAGTDLDLRQVAPTIFRRR